MRRLASFLLLSVALAAGATEVWRWKDADGVVHYSDSPVPGAERVNAGPAPKPGSVTVQPPAASLREPDTTVRYTRCEVTQPANNETFNSVDAVGASVAIEPQLQFGHHIQAYLNGSSYPQWPGSATGHTLTGLFRGAYTFSVSVLDAGGRTLCTAPTISFYIQQPSVLSPARQPPKKN